MIVGTVESEKFDITNEIILKEGGESIQAELHKWLEHNDGVPDGDAVLSEAGSLKCKYILHVVGTFAVEGEEGPRRATRHLYGCIKNLLDNADYLCASSISIPASLTKAALGSLAPDPADAADLIVSACVDWLDDHRRYECDVATIRICTDD